MDARPTCLTEVAARTRNEGAGRAQTSAATDPRSGDNQDRLKVLVRALAQQAAREAFAAASASNATLPDITAADG